MMNPIHDYLSYQTVLSFIHSTAIVSLLSEIKYIMLNHFDTQAQLRELVCVLSMNSCFAASPKHWTWITHGISILKLHWTSFFNKFKLNFMN